MPVEKVLIAGEWREAKATSSFHAENPATAQPLEGEFPVSGWQDINDALAAAATAAVELRSVPVETLRDYFTTLSVLPEDALMYFIVKVH